VSTATGAASRAKTPLPTIFAFGSVGLPLAGILLIYAVYLPRFYVGLGISFVLVGAAIFVVRVIDALFDPLVALLMDRTKTPIGRYRPWLLLGAPLAIIGIYKVLIPPDHVGVPYLIPWLLVTYAGLSMLNLGFAAWVSVLAKDYDERSRLFGWTQAMAVIGSVGLLLLPKLTHNKVSPGFAASMPTIALILMIALPLTVAICTMFTPERIAAAPPRPRFSARDYWGAITRPSMLRITLADLMLTLGPGTTAPLYVFFFHDAKGFSIPDVSLLLIAYIGAGIIGAPFWARVARRVGKHRTIQIVCVCYAIAQTTLMALPRVWHSYTLIQAVPTVAGMFAVGFMASAFLPLIRAMVADVADEVKLEQNQDLTSLLYSMVTTTTKIGATIIVLAVFPVLQMVGYNGKEGAINTPHAIFGLEMCYLFAPIILVFGGGAALIGYGLDAKRHGAIREALEAREESLSIAAAEESMIGAAPQQV
jgi:GPH family glycoside/pentoside/hexuronide:cation symporter